MFSSGWASHDKVRYSSVGWVATSQAVSTAELTRYKYTGFVKEFSNVSEVGGWFCGFFCGMATTKRMLLYLHVRL